MISSYAGMLSISAWPCIRAGLAWLTNPGMDLHVGIDPAPMSVPGVAA